MMKAADLRDRDHLATLWRFDLSFDGRVAIQGKMRSGTHVVIKIVRQNSAEMAFVEHNHVIQTLPSDRSDEAFRIRILPRRLWSRNDFFDAHAFDASLKLTAIDTIAITNQESWRGIVGKRLDHLLCGPRGRWMSRHVEMDDMPPIVTQHDKGEEYAKRGSRDCEEIDRDDVLQVIVQERSPCR